MKGEPKYLLVLDVVLREKKRVEDYYKFLATEGPQHEENHQD